MAKMPAHTRRAHAKGAEWHGDTLGALGEAKRHHFKYVDQNVQWVFERPARRGVDPAGEAFVMHWGDPRRNDFHYYLEPGATRARRMRRAESRRSLPGGWSVEQVKRWRRGPQPGSARPHTLTEHFREAVDLGVTIIPELKSQAFARPEPAAHVVEAAKSTGHPPWFMTLWYMRKAKGKVAAIEGAGGQMALIFGRRKYLRPVARAAVRAWAVKPTRIW